MEYSDKINLYRERSFSRKINATVEFIRQNFRIMGLTILIILVPLAFISAILSGEYSHYSFSSLNGYNPSFGAQLSDVFNGAYFGLLAVSTLSNIIITSLILNYMKLYHNKFPMEITVGEVFSAMIRNILPLIILSVITFIIIVISTIFFVIPGIYLGIVLSLAFPIFIFEDKNDIFDAIGRCFTLIKEKWWSTLGLLITSGLIMFAITAIFRLVFIALFALILFQETSLENLQFDIEGTWMQYVLIILLVIITLVSYLAYLFPVIALAFQYFNLRERQESVGLMEDISKLTSEKEDPTL